MLFPITLLWCLAEGRSSAWQALSPWAGHRASSPPFTSFLLLFSPAQQFIGIITFCRAWGRGQGLALWQGAGTATPLSHGVCIVPAVDLVGGHRLGGDPTLRCTAQGGCLPFLHTAPAVPGDSEGPH